MESRELPRAYACLLACLGVLFSYRRFSWSTYDFPCWIIEGDVEAWSLSLPTMLSIAMASWFGLRCFYSFAMREGMVLCVYWLIVLSRYYGT